MHGVMGEDFPFDCPAPSAPHSQDGTKYSQVLTSSGAGSSGVYQVSRREQCPFLLTSREVVEADDST